MFLIDDLLAAPARGLMFVLEKVNEAVQKELEAQERSAMADLTALHRALEEGRITEAEFDAREGKLLDRLDRLHAQAQVEGEGDETGDDRS
jgi:hypothetical protein